MLTAPVTNAQQKHACPRETSNMKTLCTDEERHLLVVMLSDGHMIYRSTHVSRETWTLALYLKTPHYSEWPISHILLIDMFGL